MLSHRRSHLPPLHSSSGRRRPQWLQRYLLPAMLIFAFQITALYILHDYFHRPTTMLHQTQRQRVPPLPGPQPARMAWAIPVGGRTERSKLLEEMLDNLREHGAENIFIFEDVLSRANRLASPLVAQAAKAHGVTVVSHKLQREVDPTKRMDGLDLARHYRFMLDAVFVHGVPLGTGTTRATFDYIVVLEDDLRLAPDTVKFFSEMARVMDVDPTLYCACAHVDNGWFATAPDQRARGMVLQSGDFDFRRANHFMAPGWMMPKQVYTHTVRPQWLDADGNYRYFRQQGLKNGHWDRFFDSRIGDMECIFPEVPRVLHDGAGGFTVSRLAQLDLYSNLRLSATDPRHYDYGDLRRLTADGYEEAIRHFLRDSTLVRVPEEINTLRHAKLRMVIPAKHDLHGAWSQLFDTYFGVIALGGFGGNPKYAKMRSVHQGSVFIRWMTNLVLVIGEYSPYYTAAIQHEDTLPQPVALHYGGCYEDAWQPRILPHHVWHYDAQTVTPEKCVMSCHFLGYPFAGLQNGEECWCGNKLKAQRVDESECNRECAAARESLLTPGGLGNWFRSAVGATNVHTACGAALKNSVYWWHGGFDDEEKVAGTKHDMVPLPAFGAAQDASFMAAGPGESCTVACRREGRLCDEQLFPLLTHNCVVLQALLGCEQCVTPNPGLETFISPGRNTHKACTITKGKDVQCEATPEGRVGFRRACVCRL